MTKMKTLFAGLMFCLTGCSGVTPADYAGAEPKLDLREYFNGKIEAHGILVDYNGKADTHFSIAMEGKWDGNDGVLTEDFTYNDGRKDFRTWNIKVADNGTDIIGTAADVIGEAKGSQQGNTVNMKYVLQAKRAEGGTIDLSMNDWMYRISEKVMINRIKMYKFGLPVGELIITFNKP